MGRTTVTLEATASLSSHNSPQDDRDAERWNAFVEKVRKLAAEHEEEIYLYVMADERHVVGWKD